MLSMKEVLEVVRKHTAEVVLRAVLSEYVAAGLQDQVSRHKRVIAKLVDILEKKKILRRGNIVSLYCAAEGAPDGGE